MSDKIKISTNKVNVFYGDKKALDNICLEIPEKKVTSLIGPSGCGKSTFIRCLNRMNDTIDICRIEGKIIIDNEDIEKYHDNSYLNIVEFNNLYWAEYNGK